MSNRHFDIVSSVLIDQRASRFWFTQKMFTLPREQDSKLVAKVVFKVYEASVGVNVFGSCIR